MSDERTIRLVARALAHDLANFSLVVRGHAELLRDGDEPDVAGCADAILRASAKVTTLGARLRSIAATGPTHPAVVDAAMVVDDVLALLAHDTPTVATPPVAVAAHDDGPQWILADPYRLTEDLIDRYFAATDAGATTVRFRTSVEDEGPAGVVVISVVGDAPSGPTNGGNETVLRFPQAQAGTVVR